MASLTQLSEIGGQFRDHLRGALVDRFAVAEEGGLELEFRQFLQHYLFTIARTLDGSPV
jgi:hypothetical protein